MAISSTTPISSPVLQNLSASRTAAEKTDAASQQDRFMKLLVAQLNNQDPMNPMDNAQLTSQTAQISTVSGIEKLNDSVLASPADKVSVQIFSPGGQLLDTLELGSLKAGRQQFSWDASNYTGGGALSFKVAASKAGQAIPATALSRDTITSIGNDGSAMSIALKSGATVRYEQIKAVL